jgi:hypothetical protein
MSARTRTTRSRRENLKATISALSKQLEHFETSTAWKKGMPFIIKRETPASRSPKRIGKLEASVRQIRPKEAWRRLGCPSYRDGGLAR